MKKYSVVIPLNLKSRPSNNEVSVAWILADYFQCNIEFVARNSQKSADYLIQRKYWELKTIEGNGKRTIQHALQKAARQAENVIIDARKTKMHITKVRTQIQHHLKYIPRIKRLLLIEKGRKIVEFFK